MIANIDVVTSGNRDDITRWSQECLDEKLHTPEGLTQEAFRGKITIIAMTYAAKIGWCVVMNASEMYKVYKNPLISVFVREDMRRKHIGSLMVQDMFQFFGDKMPYVEHSPVNKAFWQSVTKLVSK